MFYNISLDDLLNNSNDGDSFSVDDDIEILDNDWVKSRFMISDDMLHSVDAINRYNSSATNKFTDSSLGGNIHINPRPQYTRYCDIRVKGNILDRKDVTLAKSVENGMGRYYSESIDDNQQVVFMQFGVPKFNNLIDFFLNAIDYVDSVVANTGRSPTMYNIGKLLGSGIMLAAFPLITITIWAVKWATKIVFGHGTFDYYRLDPAMVNYWGSVNSLVTNIATEMGFLIPEFLPNSNNESGNVGVPLKIDKSQAKLLAELMPGLISPLTNYIDVFAIATKAQYRANRQKYLEHKALAKRKIDINQLTDALMDEHRTEPVVVDKKISLSEWFNLTVMFGKYDKDSPDGLVQVSNEVREHGDVKHETTNEQPPAESKTNEPARVTKPDGTMEVNPDH